jgi:hypothetical protein
MSTRRFDRYPGHDRKRFLVHERSSQFFIQVARSEGAVALTGIIKTEPLAAKA